MISGFQNHLHLIYGLPNGWQSRLTDTSDILSRGLKRKRKREDEQLEEQIAAQILRARQEPIEIPAKTNVLKLAKILQAKMYAPASGEVTGDDRIKRIKYLLLVLTMDD